MKLVRFGALGAERPGLIDGAGALRDLSSVIGDLGPASVSLESLARLGEIDPAAAPLVAEDAYGAGAPRLGAPLRDAPNFFCIGLNYARHAAETGAAPPQEPVVFNKATSALSGPFDPILLPPGAEQADWEVELGVVIGREATRISEEAALGHVAGYLCVNDVSERHFQGERGGQWVKGKSAPSFGKIGPVLATADEVANPQTLRLWTRVNGEPAQDSSTEDMIFDVAMIISYLSHFMTLRVGDVIATGTPEGVGLGRTPPRFLRAGDVVELGVEGLGEQRAIVEAVST
ncbi:MAG: fumarylacetoacetate hydrolase family protein [Pseudomonadota bacterium]